MILLPDNSDGDFANLQIIAKTGLDLIDRTNKITKECQPRMHQ